MSDRPTEQLALGLAARDKAAAKHEQEIATLIPLALELAKKAHPEPIIVADLRLTAVQRGLLPAESKGRALSWLGAVMPRAGLVPRGYRRSHLNKSHGNIQQSWGLAA